MSVVNSVNQQDFEREVLQAAEPVLVDFGADWCPPCRAIAPVIDRVAAKFAGQLKVVKCDVAENGPIAARYGVRSIPNLVFFRNGQVVSQTVGTVTEGALGQKVAEVVAA